MSIIVKQLDVKNLGILEETNKLITNQFFLKTLDATDEVLIYAKSRYIKDEYLSDFFSVNNIYEWLNNNCKLDDNDISFISLKLRNILKDRKVKTLEELKDGVKFLGNICRNVEGDIIGVSFRSINYTNLLFNGKRNKRVFLRFFYNKLQNAYEIWYDRFAGYLKDQELEGLVINNWNDIDYLKKIREYSWFKCKKTQLNSDDIIFVTEGLYDSLFLNNSICAGGLLSMLVIPEKLKNKKLLFITDNQNISTIHKTNLHLLKMGYSVFKWPKELITCKDFCTYSDLLRDHYGTRLTEQELLEETANNIKIMAHSEKNIFNPGDIKGYENWITNRYK